MLRTLVLLFLATACTATRTFLDGADRHELLRVRESVWRSWFAGDHATLERLLTDDFLAIDAEGAVNAGRDHQIAGAAAFAASGGRLTRLAFPVTEVQLLGDVAVIYTTYELELATPDGPVEMRGRATEVFRRRGDSWVHPGWHLDVQ